MFSRKIKLPTSSKEFDELTNLIIKKYKLTDAHHAAAILSVAIRHIPNEVAYVKMDQLGHYILKNLANYVAHTKGEQIKHEGQVAQLVSMIKQDPNNQQLRDELQKASDEGSLTAKIALNKLLAEEPAKEPTDNVVSIGVPIASEFTQEART